MSSIIGAASGKHPAGAKPSAGVPAGGADFESVVAGLTNAVDAAAAAVAPGALGPPATIGSPVADEAKTAPTTVTVDGQIPASPATTAIYDPAAASAAGAATLAAPVPATPAAVTHAAASAGIIPSVSTADTASEASPAVAAATPSAAIADVAIPVPPDAPMTVAKPVKSTSTKGTGEVETKPAETEEKTNMVDKSEPGKAQLVRKKDKSDRSDDTVAQATLALTPASPQPIVQAVAAQVVTAQAAAAYAGAPAPVTQGKTAKAAPTEAAAATAIASAAAPAETSTKAVPATLAAPRTASAAFKNAATVSSDAASPSKAGTLPSDPVVTAASARGGGDGAPSDKQRNGDSSQQSAPALADIVQGLPPIIQSRMGGASDLAPATPTAVTTDIGSVLSGQAIDMGASGQWIDRMAQEITNLAQGSGVSRFQLSPPNLGRIQIEIAQGVDGGRVQMLTETDEAAQRLRDGSSSLQADARLSSLSLTSITIERAPGAFGASNDPSSQSGQNSQTGSQRHQTTSDFLSQSGGQSTGQNGAQAGNNGGSATGQGKNPLRRDVFNDRTETASQDSRASGRTDGRQVRYA